MSDEEDWFERSWTYRDQTLYRDFLGGEPDASIVTIPYVAFEQLGFKKIDPRWLHCGVLKFFPSVSSANFKFVTSGLSNAWDDQTPDSLSESGLGIEFRADSVTDEYWIIDVLLRLSAVQLLVGAGHLQGSRIASDGDRIVVGRNVFGESSVLDSLLATSVAKLRLPSGNFEVLQLFAISSAERDYATRHGHENLRNLLREKTSYPVNDITRSSIF